MLGLIALPVWLIGQLLGGRVRDLLVGLERRQRQLPVPPERERSMEALMVDLGAIPQHLEERPVNDLRFGLRDISSFVVAQPREGAVLGYPYPAQFDDHVFEGADGERIAATIALQEAARPGPDRRPRRSSPRAASTTCGGSPCAPSTSGASTSRSSTCAASASPS